MNGESYKDIKIEDDHLEKVESFKAIVAQGTRRPTLTAEQSKDLVRSKFDSAKSMKDHITLFRVPDKKKLGPKEIKEHTVPGPNWTPPSSVGFVMGALNAGHRVWLASPLSDDENGLYGSDGNPSIYTRENMTALLYGWTPRAANREKYGKTGRGPKIVYSPPIQPRNVEPKKIQSIMDVQASWKDLPISAKKLMHIPILSLLKLKENNLDTNDVEEDILETISDENIQDLIQKGLIDCSLVYLSNHVLVTLLDGEEITALLEQGKISFKVLVEIYAEYIENSEQAEEINEFGLHEFYKFILENEDDINKLVSELNIPITRIIAECSNQPENLKKLAHDITIECIKENNLAWSEMADLLNDDSEIADQALKYYEHGDGINSLEITIRDLRIAKKEIEELPDDYISERPSPYELLIAQEIEDGCPEGWIQNDSESEDSDGDNERAEELYYEEVIEDEGNISSEDFDEGTNSSEQDWSWWVFENCKDVDLQGDI